jgi:hypothetical protein
MFRCELRVLVTWPALVPKHVGKKREFLCCVKAAWGRSDGDPANVEAQSSPPSPLIAVAASRTSLDAAAELSRKRSWRTEPVRGLLKRFVRQADDIERWQSGRHLHLNIDRTGLDPLESYRRYCAKLAYGMGITG